MGIGVPLAVIDQQRPRSADNEFDREPKLVTAEPRTTVAGYPDKFRHAFVAFRHACDQTDYEDAGETAPGAREDACDHPSMPDGCRQERSRITPSTCSTTRSIARIFYATHMT